MWFGLLIGCPRPPLPPMDPPAAYARAEVPAVILPHCLWGIDPHLQGVEVVDGGYLLSMSGAHALRYAGFEDGDEVQGVLDLPLGTAADWAAARTASAGVTECWWTVQRDGSPRRIAAALVDAPLPAATRIRADGVAEVSRGAIAVALTDPHRRGPLRGWTADGVVPAHHLRDVADLLGLPLGCSVVDVDGASITNDAALEAAVLTLFAIDASRWSCAGGPTLDITLRGPVLPSPPP